MIIFYITLYRPNMSQNQERRRFHSDDTIQSEATTQFDSIQATSQFGNSTQDTRASQGAPEGLRPALPPKS